MSVEADDRYERAVWYPIRATALRIFAETRLVDVRALDTLPPHEHLNRLQRIASDLVDDSLELFEQVVSTFGIASGHRPSSRLPFELALDAAVRDAYDVGALAELIRLEFRVRRAKLIEVPRMNPIVALSECDRAIDGVGKALSAFDLAAARASHASSTIPFAFELDRSLAARRAYARLAFRIGAELGSGAGAVVDHLEQVALAIEQLILHELYADLRVADRVLLRSAQKELAAWSKRRADPDAMITAARIGNELTLLVGVLSRVNRRQELLDHDSALIQEALGRASTTNTGMFSAEFVRRLQSLWGLNRELDQLLESTRVARVAAWLPVFANLGQPYVDIARRGRST